MHSAHLENEAYKDDSGLGAFLLPIVILAAITIGVIYKCYFSKRKNNRIELANVKYEGKFERQISLISDIEDGSYICPNEYQNA